MKFRKEGEGAEEREKMNDCERRKRKGSTRGTFGRIMGTYMLNEL